MHDFFDIKEPTMLKSPRFRAWRPDKVVTQIKPNELKCLDPKKHHWKVIKAEIVGKEVVPSFKGKNESPSLVEKDGVVRTPSDHFGIVVDLRYE